MKVMLYVVLEKGAATRSLINQIIKDGYNGTLIRTKGLKHMGEGNEGAYLSLSQIAENTEEASTTIFFILEEEKLNHIKEDIRKYTEGFTKIHGGMFEAPISSFEGSF